MQKEVGQLNQTISELCQQFIVSAVRAHSIYQILLEVTLASSPSLTSPSIIGYHHSAIIQ